MTDLEELKRRLRIISEWLGDDNELPSSGDAVAVLDAVGAIEWLQRQNIILLAERDQARAQRDFLVKVLGRIENFITPKDVTLPDGRRFEFNNPAIEHDMLKALSAAIRAVPDELKKSESAQPGDEWRI